MRVSRSRIGIHWFTLHCKEFIYILWEKHTNSKRPITGHIKSFRYEVVSPTAQTCSDDGLLKHLKGLCIMGREKKYTFRCFRYRILDCSSCIDMNVTKARRYVYELVGDQVIKLAFDFGVAGDACRPGVCSE